MTLESLADLAWAMDQSVKLHLENGQSGRGNANTITTTAVALSGDTESPPIATNQNFLKEMTFG